MQFRLRGREFVIEKRLPDGRIRIKDIITDERSALPEQELIEAVFENNAELLGQDRNQEVLKQRLSKTGVCDIACLNENDPRRLEFERRFSYVRAVALARLDKQTPDTLAPFISKVANRINDPKPPSVSTVWRWNRIYNNSGEDARSLVPATQARGNRKRRFFGRRVKEGELKNNPKAQERSTKVAELLKRAIDEVYLKDQRFTVQAVYDALLVKVDDANQFRESDDQLPQPKRSGVYAAIAKLDDYEVIEARFGKKIADEKYRAVLLGPRPSRPNERVEGDHTILDLFVIDPTMWLPIGRAYLTWMMCVFTKMILGFYISFNPPSYLTVMECLKHSIRPKTYLRKKFPSIRNDWNPYGIPEMLVVDNAREFHGRNLEDACHQLGIVLQFSQKGKPWLRPTIERSFRTLATQLLHQLPGTTFSNIFDRADYEPGKTAIVTPDTLDEIVHKWIADVYQCSEHRGIRDTPALRWEKGIAEWPPALPVNNELLDVALGYTEERVVSAKGIELDNLFYNDDELALVRRGVDSHKKVIIKRNPSDLSLIHVYDQKHNIYLPVPAVDQKYTKGLTLYQHNVISRYVRNELKRKVDVLSLARAKQEIQEIVEREWTSAATKKKTRKRLARYRGEGVQKRESIERSLSHDKTDGPRLIPNSVPHLLLPPLNEEPLEEPTDVYTPSNLESAHVNKRKPKLKLVASKKEAEFAHHKSAGNNLRDIKEKSSKKVPATNPTSSARKNRTTQQASRPEELDMTGWSGDYNLPK
jgi:putative transposase